MSSEPYLVHYLATVEDDEFEGTGDEAGVTIRLYDDAIGVGLLEYGDPFSPVQRLQIERRSHGWMIYIESRLDNCIGQLSIHDDGRTGYYREQLPDVPVTECPPPRQEHSVNVDVVQ